MSAKTAPANRRPVQPLSLPSATMTTRTTDGWRQIWRQIWRQYGWIDSEGRMYDLTEPSPRTYRAASYSPLWVLVDNEPMPEPEPERRLVRWLRRVKAATR